MINPFDHSQVYGIDVSNHNGLLNWGKWHGTIGFAEIKCTEALDFTDPLFHANMKETEDLGIYRFPYHFGHPDLDPGQQARFFTDTAGPYMEKTDHFVLDLEITCERTAAEVSFWAWTFLTEVNRLYPRHRCLVQTNPGFAAEGNCAMLGSWHLWVMDWGVPEPVMPVGPWRDWAFWQYASGAVDRDQYHGNHAHLESFVKHTGLEDVASPAPR